MSAVAVGGGRRSLVGKIAAGVLGARKGGKPGRVAAALAVAREHVVTVAALGAVDTGAWYGSRIAGWVVAGICLLALDFAVRS